MRSVPFSIGVPVLLLLGFMACRNQVESGSAAAQSPAQEKELLGLYLGVLPCTDCAGVQTSISLFPDHTGRITELHSGKYSNQAARNTAFTWDFQSGMLHLTGVNNERTPLQYNEGEGCLLLMPCVNQLKQDAAPNPCRLNKVTTDILDRKWILTTLQGKAVEKSEAMKELPFLTLSWKEGRAGGYAGCNTFGGAYELSTNKRLRFQDLITTMMACEHMEIEFGLMEVLKNTSHYSITHDILILAGGDADTLARFRAD